MKNLDYTIKTITPAVQTAVANIIEALTMQLNSANGTLASVRALIQEHGRAAIVMEIGDSAKAAALLAIYNHFKDAVETGQGVTLEDLPE